MIGRLMRQTYPIPPSGVEGILVSLGLSLFVAFFLLFFRPFDLNSLPYSVLEILFFGVIAFVVFVTGHSVLPFFFPNIYDERKWTVFHQILFYLLISFVIATFNGLYINYINSLDFSWENYWFIITRTVMVGAIPITLYVLLSFNWKYSRMLQKADELNQNIKTKIAQAPPPVQIIQTNLKNETFSLTEQDFLFAKADGNYIEIHQLQQKPEVHRLNLADLEAQLTNPYMLRCHRSYLVNTKKVIKVTGNAQGLKLWLEEEALFVPVSRRYIGPIKKLFEKGTPAT
ncbi:MAG: LytTR family DNA-binding domain-containing protein [Bacteroidota bacterium]